MTAIIAVMRVMRGAEEGVQGTRGGPGRSPGGVKARSPGGGGGAEPPAVTIRFLHSF